MPIVVSTRSGRREPRSGRERVRAAARNVKQLTELVESAPNEIVPLELDITSQRSIEDAAARATDVTVLINNAGVLAAYGFLATHRSGARDRLRDLNSSGHWRRRKRSWAKRSGRRAGGGALVNILSVVSMASMPALGGYSASKAASFSATQALPRISPSGTSPRHGRPRRPIDLNAWVRSSDMPKTSPEAVARAGHRWRRGRPRENSPRPDLAPDVRGVEARPEGSRASARKYVALEDRDVRDCTQSSMSFTPAASITLPAFFGSRTVESGLVRRVMSGEAVGLQDEQRARAQSFVPAVSSAEVQRGTAVSPRWQLEQFSVKVDPRALLEQGVAEQVGEGRERGTRTGRRREQTNARRIDLIRLSPSRYTVVRFNAARLETERSPRLRWCDTRDSERARIAPRLISDRARLADDAFAFTARSRRRSRHTLPRPPAVEMANEERVSINFPPTRKCFIVTESFERSPNPRQDRSRSSCHRGSRSTATCRAIGPERVLSSYGIIPTEGFFAVGRVDAARWERGSGSCRLRAFRGGTTRKTLPLPGKRVETARVRHSSSANDTSSAKRGSRDDPNFRSVRINPSLAGCSYVFVTPNGDATLAYG